MVQLFYHKQLVIYVVSVNSAERIHKNRVVSVISTGD